MRAVSSVTSNPDGSELFFAWWRMNGQLQGGDEVNIGALAQACHVASMPDYLRLLSIGNICVEKRHGSRRQNKGPNRIFKCLALIRGVFKASYNLFLARSQLIDAPYTIGTAGVSRALMTSMFSSVHPAAFLVTPVLIGCGSPSAISSSHLGGLTLDLMAALLAPTISGTWAAAAGPSVIRGPRRDLMALVRD
jgi:hypothetical protein